MDEQNAAIDRLRKVLLGAASRRSDVPPFMVMDVMTAAARLEAQGRHIVHLEVGQPSSPAPTAASAAVVAALGPGGLDPRLLGYTESLGRPTLRERVARHYAERYGLAVDPGTIAVTTGSSGAFVLAFLALLEAGDRVALSVPAYPPYRHILSALGCEPVLIRVGPETRYALTPEALLAQHRRTPLKAVLIASPANPTGTMMTHEALAALVAAAEEAGIAVISDEIYHGLDYAFPATTARAISPNVVVVNSFSKYFCMTGHRIGWLVLPEALVRAVERLHQNLAISVPTLSQIAAEAAFEGRAEMEAVKAGYVRNRDILVKGLPACGLDRFLPADGAFYLYADVSAFTDDSLAFARDMLEQAGVAATPGLDFDPAEGRRFVRFSYAGSEADMAEAVRRLGAWLGR